MTSAAFDHLHDANTASRLAWPREFRGALLDTAPVWSVVVAYAVLAVAAACALGVSFVQSVAGYLPFAAGLIQVSIALGALIVVWRIAVIEKSRHPMRRLREEIAHHASPAIAARAVILLASSCSLQVIYGFFKPLIPRFSNYRWDPVLSAADRLIFLGHQPWEVLWPILGHSAVIFALNVLYNLWFCWMLLVWVLVAFSTRHRDANTQYFLAHVFLWSVGGTAIAIVFAAAGPCYYAGFNAGADPYRDLMTRLLAMNDRVPVFSLAVQAMLWDSHLHPDPSKIAGISALPSLHVAAAVLRTRIAFTHSRKLGLVCAAATFAIFLASIVLGWHYAVDGLAGAAVALTSWWLAGKTMEYWRGRDVAAALQSVPS